MQRYEQLRELVGQLKPRSICEVGTWNGDRAIDLCEEALKHQKAVLYIGIDLFEDITPEISKAELNVKPAFSLAQVKARLDAFRMDNPGFTYALKKGNSRDVLPAMKDGAEKLDFVFIDGGHSIETIRSDFDALRSAKVVALDDYYSEDDAGRKPDITRFGCNAVVAGINHTLLGRGDPVTGGGLVRLAVVGWTPKVNMRVETKNCVPDGNIQENIRYALSKDLKFVWQCREHQKMAVVCSGGPTLDKFYDAIKKDQADGGLVFCVKHSHDKLIERGIVPFGCILLDPRSHVQDFIENPHPDVRYFTATMCHPSTLDRLIEKKATIWAYNALVGAGEDKILGPLNHMMVPGGSTSATRGLALLRVVGFRRFRLYGYDSNYVDVDVVRKKGAAYWEERADNYEHMVRRCAVIAHYWHELDLQKATELGREAVKDSKAIPEIREPVFTVTPDIAGDVLGEFWTDAELLAQVQDFEKLAKAMPECDFEVFGDGFIPSAYRGLSRHNKLPKVGDFDGILGTRVNDAGADAAASDGAKQLAAYRRSKRHRGRRTAGAVGTARTSQSRGGHGGKRT